MIPFHKAHACGNDFLVLDETAANPSQFAALARHLCARSTGVGADGIEFLSQTPNKHPSLRLFNADGSEAELSGNGTRCVAAVLAHTQGRDDITFLTHAGTRRCRVLHQSGAIFHIESTMGLPRVMPRTLTIDPLPDGTAELHAAMVNVGNPHLVLFVDPTTNPDPDPEDFSVHGLPWQQLGARLATDPRFPHGTNVEFVRILGPNPSPDRIALRIFERGVGPTASSGTGTCAAATAAIALRHCGRALTAIAPGGPQEVAWPNPEAELLLTGPATLLCRGEAFNPLPPIFEDDLPDLAL